MSYGKVTPKNLAIASERADRAGQLGLSVHLTLLASWLSNHPDGFPLPAIEPLRFEQALAERDSLAAGIRDDKAK